MERANSFAMLFGDQSNCEIVRHQQNRGVAAATLTGIEHAKTEIVCVIDCDCSYDIENLGRFIPLLDEGVDLVTASPYHKDGGVLNIPGWRLLLSRGASVLYRMVLKTKLATYTACFRAYRRSAVVDLEVSNERYLGITEILALLDQRGCRIIECPAVLEPRLFGQSKMKVLMTIGGHLRLLAKLAFGVGLGAYKGSTTRRLRSRQRGWSVGTASQGAVTSAGDEGP